MQKRTTQRTYTREKIFTKERQFSSNYRVNRQELDLLIAAARNLGESRSEFLRRAVKERAARVLGVQPGNAVNE